MYRVYTVSSYRTRNRVLSLNFVSDLGTFWTREQRCITSKSWANVTETSVPRWHRSLGNAVRVLYSTMGPLFSATCVGNRLPHTLQLATREDIFPEEKCDSFQNYLSDATFTAGVIIV